MATRKYPSKDSRKRTQQHGAEDNSVVKTELPRTRPADDNRAAKKPVPREQLSAITNQPIGAALRDSAIGMAIINAKGHFLLVNDVFCRMTGYDEQELLSRDWLSLSHPDVRGKNNALTWRVEQYKVPGFSVEKRCATKEGRELWLRSSLSPLQQNGSRWPLFLALVEDITDNKRAEHALAAKESALREAQRLAQLGSWHWDPETDAVVWSDELYRAARYDGELPPPTFSQHKQFFSKESWEELSRNVRETLRTGIPYELELEIVRRDGTRGWAISRGEPVRDDSGRIVRLRGTIQDITARKRVEEALQKSEEKFVTAFNAVPVAVTLVTAAEGRQIEVNEALLKMTGYAREEVIGRNFRELGYWQDPTDRQALVARMLAGEHLRNEECQFRRKNGELFNGLLSADLIELEGQQCIVAAAMDISELRRAEEEARGLASKLALHFQQTMVGVIEFSLDGKVNEWNPAAEAMFGYSRDDAVGKFARDLIIPEDLSTHLASEFFEIVQEKRGRYSTTRNVTKEGKKLVCAWFSTPLVQEDGAVSGVVSLVSDVTAEKKAQAELAASEATLSAIFQSTDDSIWTVDAERFGVMTFNSAASESYAKNRGITLRVGMTPDELAPPDVAKWWKERYREAMRTGTFETDYVPVDSTNVLRLAFNPMLRDGKVFGVSVFARNVTQRRRAERELQRSEERYRHLVASSSDWVWEFDADGRYTYASPQCREILGYEPEEVVGKTPFDLMPPEEAQRVGMIFRAIAAEQKPFRALENTNLHKDGRLVVLETNGIPMFDSEWNFCGYRGMARDITQRKQSEMALRESESRLRLALEGGRMYAFEWNIQTDVLMRSTEYATMIGIPAYRTEEKGKEFLSHLDPEDRRHYVDGLSQLTPEQDRYHTTYRKELPNGKLCWMEARGRGFFDNDGNLVRVIGIAADVTARKESEDALRTVSACLINAQENERKRVARELHDGVSQALAVVSIQLAQAANAASEADIKSKLDKLYERLQGVLSDIEHLSHELHPSTLKHLGLSAAIRALCEEITQSHGIEVEFIDRSAPQAPSKDTALCLYRVAQEALRNIVKHGQCVQACVELEGNQSEVRLLISDRGIGFNTHSVKAGLGLTSMRERMRLIGGRIVISSRPGVGTRITAYAPLERHESQTAA